MIVAGNNTGAPAAFGSTEKSVYVRQPLMILPTMPRVYRELPDEEISRIFAYLKTLAPSGAKGKNQT